NFIITFVSLLQTFHTPSFGDEEFDIPPINPQQQQQGHTDQQHYQPPIQGMQQLNQQMNQQQDAMGMHDPTGGYQQPLYLSGPDHGMVNSSYHSPQPNYSMSPSQQQQHNNQLLIIQQQQQHQQHQQMMMSHGQPPPWSHGAEPTTSEDSDDSTPHPAIITAMKRPSPEPADQTKTQKKPKVQKKKKKRDPNEPQKPVSAYALFFRDTQAAIKGQNPNASFGEVSKIVASMWDALDSEHKNHTEQVLYPKVLVKVASMYSNYENYQQNAPQYASYQPQGTIPSPPMSSAPTPPTQSPIGKKPSMIGNMNPSSQQQQHQNMMPNMGPVPSHMNMQHMQQQQQHNSYMQQRVMLAAQTKTEFSSPLILLQFGKGFTTTTYACIATATARSIITSHAATYEPPPMVSSSPPVSAPQPTVPTSQQNTGQGQMRPPKCMYRHGCPNPAITNPEWESEYCSNECVVSHLQASRGYKFFEINALPMISRSLCTSEFRIRVIRMFSQTGFQETRTSHRIFQQLNKFYSREHCKNEDSKKAIPTDQAFQAERSPETALHKFWTKIEKKLEQGSFAFGTFGDIEGIFDNATFDYVYSNDRTRSKLHYCKLPPLPVIIVEARLASMRLQCAGQWQTSSDIREHGKIWMHLRNQDVFQMFSDSMQLKPTDQLGSSLLNLNRRQTKAIIGAPTDHSVPYRGTDRKWDSQATLLAEAVMKESTLHILLQGGFGVPNF
ncbi:hypothetical protein NQ317_000818, partial [Molorchus minor]